MRFKLLSIISLFFLISCGKVPTPEPNAPFEHFVGDFEDANISKFHPLMVDTTVNATIVTNPVRKGTFALKNILLPSDYIFQGYRSELAVYNCAEYHTEVYYGFSFFIDTNYQDEQFSLLCQWQDLPNFEQGENWEPSPTFHASPPPVALVYLNGALELKMNDTPNGNNSTYIVGAPRAISKGQWYDVVAHVYWSDDDTAFIELWINGIPLTSFNGTDYKFYSRNLFNRAGNYFKFGQYRGKIQPLIKNIVYFDEVKVGSSYTEVSP